MSSDGYLYFSGTCSGGLSRVPIAVFGDARAPHERAADIQLVSPRPSASDFDTLKGLTVNRFDRHDDAIYAADPFHLRIVRIDVTTGAREVVAADPLLFTFPVSMKMVRGEGGQGTLVVSSDQEHRFSALNAALAGVDLVPVPVPVDGNSSAAVIDEPRRHGGRPQVLCSVPPCLRVSLVRDRPGARSRPAALRTSASAGRAASSAACRAP